MTSLGLKLSILIFFITSYPSCLNFLLSSYLACDFYSCTKARHTISIMPCHFLSSATGILYALFILLCTLSGMTHAFSDFNTDQSILMDESGRGWVENMKS